MQTLLSAGSACGVAPSQAGVRPACPSGPFPDLPRHVPAAGKALWGRVTSAEPQEPSEHLPTAPPWSPEPHTSEGDTEALRGGVTCRGPSADSFPCGRAGRSVLRRAPGGCPGSWGVNGVWDPWGLGPSACRGCSGVSSSPQHAHFPKVCLGTGGLSPLTTPPRAHSQGEHQKAPGSLVFSCISCPNAGLSVTPPSNCSRSLPPQAPPGLSCCRGRPAAAPRAHSRPYSRASAASGGALGK